MTLLFPTCLLPGCENTVEQAGHPCPTCLEELGPFLARTEGPGMTAEEIAERDALMVTVQRQLNGRERKANRLCWICDERHTCTRQPAGWECDECVEIR